MLPVLYTHCSRSVVLFLTGFAALAVSILLKTDKNRKRKKTADREFACRVNWKNRESR